MMDGIKPIVFAGLPGYDAGLEATGPDVVNAIRNWQREPALRGLWQYCLNLAYQRE